MSRRRATLGLIGGVLLFMTLMAAPQPAPPKTVVAGRGDVAAFRAIVSRVRAGEGYYVAYGDELRHRGYPTRSVFNWRTPLLLSAVAEIPEAASRAVLIVLGIFLLALTLACTRHTPMLAAGAGIMQVGMMVMMTGAGGVVLGELWAGALIGLSVCVFTRGVPSVAIALGILALFLRELSAPYCAACVAVAIAQRRWRQSIGWVAGICLYLAYFAWHSNQVLTHQLTDDSAHGSPWLTLEGLPSLLRVADWHIWLRLAPPWVTAAALTLVVVGVIATATPREIRVASAAYLAFFAVAGQRFNGYWGILVWPVWALAFGYGLQTSLDAARAVAGRSSDTRRGAPGTHY